SPKRRWPHGPRHVVLPVGGIVDHRPADLRRGAIARNPPEVLAVPPELHRAASRALLVLPGELGRRGLPGADRRPAPGGRAPIVARRPRGGRGRGRSRFARPVAYVATRRRGPSAPLPRRPFGPSDPRPRPDRGRCRLPEADEDLRASPGRVGGSRPHRRGVPGLRPPLLAPDPPGG